MSIVIGGLRSNNMTDSVEKVPLFGDLPLVGKLFRKRSKDLRQREFIIFITPTLKDETTQPEALRLADYDEQIAEKMRHNQKKIFGRAYDKITRGKNELTVAIGPSGAMHSEAKMVSIEDLRTRFQEAGSGTLKPKILVRVHPDSPTGIVTDVTEAVMEAGLKFEIADSLPPFVPKFIEDAVQNEAPASDG